MTNIEETPFGACKKCHCILTEDEAPNGICDDCGQEEPLEEEDDIDDDDKYEVEEKI